MFENLRKSLGKRIIAYVFSIYLVLAIVVTAAQMFFEFKRVQGQLLEDIKEISQTLVPILSEHLWNIDEQGMNRSLERINAIEKVLGLKIYNEKGIEVAKIGSTINEAGKVVNQGMPSVSNELANKIFGYEFEINYDFVYDKKTYNVGRGVIYSGNSVVIETIKYGFILIIINSIVKTLALWLIIYLIILKFIEKPLTSLAKNTTDFKVSDPTSFDRAKNNIESLTLRKDQIGVLSMSYLEMLHTINQDFNLINEKQMEISEINSKLEDKVFERTKELNHKNSELSETLEELKNTQDLLVHQEKLASLGALSAGISHEIKNPLNLINNSAKVMSMDFLKLPELLDSIVEKGDDKDIERLKSNFHSYKHMSDIIVKNGERANRIINNMLLQSRSGQSELTKVSIKDLVIENYEITYHSIKTKYNLYTDATLELDDIGEFFVFPQDLGRVIINLIDNSFYSMAKKSEKNEEYTPELSISLNKIDDKIKIKIEDNGLGIPGEQLEKITEPFFTTKPAGQGTGLGLSMVKDIIANQHHGVLLVDSEYSEYASFTIVIPSNLNSIINQNLGDEFSFNSGKKDKNG